MFADTARVSVNLHPAGIGSVVYSSETPWMDSAQGVRLRLAGIAWNVQPSSAVSVYASALHTLTAPTDNRRGRRLRGGARPGHQRRRAVDS